jgi:hypothetical protein
MSYTKTTWKTGDVITAEKLNKIEDQVAANEEAISSAGGDDSVFIVNIDAEDSGGTITATADKTRQEMSAAADAGKPIIIRLTHNYAPSPLATSIHEMTPNIWPGPLEAGGHNFSAEKIISSVMNNTERSISTAKVVVGTNNDPDEITVNLYTYTFA